MEGETAPQEDALQFMQMIVMLRCVCSSAREEKMSTLCCAEPRVVSAAMMPMPSLRPMRETRIRSRRGTGDDGVRSDPICMGAFSCAISRAARERLSWALGWYSAGGFQCRSIVRLWGVNFGCAREVHELAKRSFNFDTLSLSVIIDLNRRQHWRRVRFVRDAAPARYSPHDLN